MTSSLRIDMFDACSENWQQAVDAKDFHSAIAVAIGGYLFYRAKRNEIISRGCLNLLQVAISLLTTDEKQEGEIGSCSFCGASGKEVKLGAGPAAYICSGCVEIFHTYFFLPTRRKT